MKQPLLALGALLSATTFNAHASLTSFTGTGNVGLVYSSVSNVTWTQDANLLSSLVTSLGFSNAINAIIAASPVIYDTPNYYDGSYNNYGSYSGQYSITANDFSPEGFTNWFGAQAFVSYLNSINYGGSSQWRLPTSNQIVGYNGTAGNELGQLFYSELGGTAGSSIPNTSSFNNEQAYYAYWLGTEYAPVPYYAWFFRNDGYQNAPNKSYMFYAWAVSPGQVSAVPVPSAVWLFGTGLVGLLGLKRRGHAG